MEQGNSSLRERLLARLPQPENVAAYREQTESLLAKHERALYWEKVTARAVIWLGVGLFIFANNNAGTLHPKLDTNATILLDVLAGILFFTGAFMQLAYHISRSKVDLMKEVKQVQLQLLELQASIKKDDVR
jgi:hypothetical protein